MKTFWHMLWYGRWSWGCEFWPDKPMIGYFHSTYDGDMAVFHLGPLWIECDY